MGFFSWKTEEGESISNAASSRGALPVYMYLPDGEVVFEKNYDGYGRFGGLDFYALVAKYNKPELCSGNAEEDRNIGIEYEFNSGTPYDKIVMPRFSIFKNLDYNKMSNPEVCEDQGYFYSNDEEWD